MQEYNEDNQLLGQKISHWQVKATPDASKALIGRLCILEPLVIEKHAEDLHRAFLASGSVVSWTYLPYGPFYTQEALKQWVQATIEEKDTQLYAIVERTTKFPVGLSGYLRINPAHGVIEVGHLHFSPLLQRTPIATEAMYLMMHYAFDELQYRRYEWKCNTLNEASKKAALRLGFQFEGIFRQSNVFKGRNRDTAWFSIIDTEWPSLKEKFESWLHPDNFDEKGQQKRRLNGE